MYLVKLYRDTAHQMLVRADRYPSVTRAAYFLGRKPADIYNWIRQRTKPKGILKFVEINKC